MAYDKAIDSAELETGLTAVADAIRSKGGTTEKLAFPDEYVLAVNAISSGMELNFEVVGGTSAPSNPKENTIWINTAEEITSWEFSETQPTGTQGMIWLATGSAKDSTAPFNAVKQNVMMLYPATAKQYIGGAWVEVNVKTYQSGAWVDWWVWDGELYIHGNEYEDVTGGWEVANVPPGGWNKYKSATLTKNASSMVFEGRLNTLFTKNKIDVTKYTTMVFRGSVNSWSTIRVKPTRDSQENGAYNDWSVGQTERRVDISSLSGGHYVSLAIYDADNRQITLTEVYME